MNQHLVLTCHIRQTFFEGTRSRYLHVTIDVNRAVSFSEQHFFRMYKKMESPNIELPKVNRIN